MKNIKADIASGKYKKVYLLFGEETYLLRKCLSALKSGVLGDEASDVNYTVFDGNRGFEVSELKDICTTLPFFADRRLVIVENSGLFGADKAFDEFIPEIPDTTVLVIVEASADKKTRLYKAVKSLGYACEFTTPTPEQTVEFCAGYLGKAEKRISKADCEFFVNSVGGDLYNITTELDKVMAYVGDRPNVSRRDIEDICSMRIENRIFDIVDALMTGRLNDAYVILFDLIRLKEQPIGILRFIMSRYLKLLAVRDEMDRGISDYEMAADLKTADWLVRKDKARVAKITSARLNAAIELCTQTENSIKLGDIGDQAGLEILLANLSAL